ncbi:MAG: transposase, partial [Sphaerochaeta sp.]|nr:transposase [Sphaerochaeta sp.]
MKKRHKALKVRIYPNTDQKLLIDKTLGSCRALYNMMLHERITFFEENKEDRKVVNGHKYKTEKEYKVEFAWMKEVDAVALQQSTADLSNAYSNFFTSLKGERRGQTVGFPKYKKKKTESSYRSVVTNNNIAVNFGCKRIKLPKVGWVSFRDKRDSAEGRIKSVTVSRSPTGKYFASVLFETEGEEIEKKAVTDPKKVIGLDMKSRYRDFISNPDNKINPDRGQNPSLIALPPRI